MNRKKCMALILGIFVSSNLVTNVTFAIENSNNNVLNIENSVEVDISNINYRINEYNKIFEYSNIVDVNGLQNGNVSSEIDKVNELESGTIIMRFDNKSTTSFQTLLSFSNNTTNNERVYVFVEGNKLGIERQSSNGSYKHVSQGLSFNSGINTVAFRVEENIGYSIFLNGVKVLNVESETTKFIKGIPGLNSVNIGLSDRLNFPENPFTGDVDFVSLYSGVIKDEDLLAITGETIANSKVGAPSIKSITPLEEGSFFNCGDKVTFNIEFDQAVSLIGNKELILLVNDIEMPLIFQEQINVKNYIFKGVIPEGISSGVYELIIKSMTGLDIVNINSKKMDFSNNIVTSGKIIIGENAISKRNLQEVVERCQLLQQGDFTNDSWSKLLQKLELANNVLQNDTSTLIEIYEVKVNLELAINSLEKLVQFNLKANKTVKSEESIDIKLSLAEIGELREVQSVDIVLTYDPTKFELRENAITAIDESKTFVKYLETTTGTVRIIVGSLGETVVENEDIVNIILNAKESLGLSNTTFIGKYAYENDIKDVKAKTIEIEVIENEIIEIREKLQQLVDSCTNLIEDDYTIESWKLLVQALNNAKKTLDNLSSTEEEVKLMLQQLQLSKDSLIEKEDIEVFKKHLEIAIEVAQGIDNFENVVPKVKFEFDEALAEAVAILDDANVTQQEVNNSFDRLSKAIHMLEFKGNKEQLLNLLAKIEQLDSKNYTAESWNSLQSVINREDIQEVINNENALQADIEKAYNYVFTAFTDLIEVSKQVNKDKLNNLIAKVENLDSDDYIKAVWINFVNMLNSAKSTSANPYATQVEVDKAYENLLRGYLDLRLKPNKDKLEGLINKVARLDSSKYTVGSYDAVQMVLLEARRVYEDENATSEDVYKVEKSLEIAIANLQSNDNENNQGEVDNNNKPKNDKGSSNNSDKLPKTGGISAAVIGIIGGITSALGFVISRKKK